MIIIPDDKIRNVKLTGDEIDLIIDELERIPYNLYMLLNYGKLIKRLKESKKEVEDD